MTINGMNEMMTEAANALKAGDEEVFFWLHGQLRGLTSEDAATLAMGIISRMMPNSSWADGPLN